MMFTPWNEIPGAQAQTHHSIRGNIYEFKPLFGMKNRLGYNSQKVGFTYGVKNTPLW
jgi:hypothetical protein